MWTGTGVRERRKGSSSWLMQCSQEDEHGGLRSCAAPAGSLTLFLTSWLLSLCFRQLFHLQSGDDDYHRELLRGLRKAIHAKYLA